MFFIRVVRVLPPLVPGSYATGGSVFGKLCTGTHILTLHIKMLLCASNTGLFSGYPGQRPAWFYEYSTPCKNSATVSRLQGPVQNSALSGVGLKAEKNAAIDKL